MRLVALLATVMSFSCLASDLAIVGFSGHYDAPNGQGTATQFDLPGQDKNTIEVRVEARGEGYVLTTPDGEWEWSEPASWVKDLQQAQWNSVDVVLQGPSQRAAINALNAEHGDKNIILKSLSANCSGSVELIESCLNGTGRIRLGQLEYKSDKAYDQTRDILHALNFAAKGNTTVKNLALDISSGKFNGEITANVGISATVKFSGLISYDVASKKVSIRLDKAKASFLDVRGKIFDELEDVQSESLVVERPWIYILND